MRADGVPAYQLAVVVDDAEQGIGEVVRGADLADSTPRQILLARLLGLPVPSYAHVPLVLAPDGSRLAKRDQAATLAGRDEQPSATLSLLAAHARADRRPCPLPLNCSSSSTPRGSRSSPSCSGVDRSSPSSTLTTTVNASPDARRSSATT